MNSARVRSSRSAFERVVVVVGEAEEVLLPLEGLLQLPLEVAVADVDVGALGLVGCWATYDVPVEQPVVLGERAQHRQVGVGAERRARGAGDLVGEAAFDLLEHRAAVRVGRVRQVVGDHRAERLLQQAPVVPGGLEVRRRVRRLVETDRVGGDPHRGQPGRGEERLRAQRPAEEEVVVEVDEVLGEVGHLVQRRLDRVRVERRQRVRRQDRRVVDDARPGGARGPASPGTWPAVTRWIRRTHGANRWMLRSE